MAKLVLPKAVSTSRANQTPLAGEILYDSTEQKVYFGDGVTQGGRSLTDDQTWDAYVYGVDVDLSVSSPSAGHTRVTLNMAHDQADDALRYTAVSAFTQMPCHNLRRCVINLTNTTAPLQYYLSASDSTKKADGTAATLTGTDGDVMVEIPVAYYRIDRYTDSNSHEHVVKLICNKFFNGSAPFPAFYVSKDGKTLQPQYIGAFKMSYQACDTTTVTDSEGNVSTVTLYKGRSVSGAGPEVNHTRADMRAAAARNGGSTTDSNKGTLTNFLLKVWIGWLAEIEYGTTDVQTAISSGFCKAASYAYYYLPNCGLTASFGNGSGSVCSDFGFTFDGDLYFRNSYDDDLRYCWINGQDKIWTKGSTVAKGDTVYSDKAVTTSAGTISAVGTAADTITVNNTVYTRTTADAVEHLGWWSEAQTYEKIWTDGPTVAKGDKVYSDSTATTSAGTISAIGLGSITFKGIVYTSYSDDDTSTTRCWRSETQTTGDYRKLWTIGSTVVAGTTVYSNNTTTTSAGAISAVSEPVWIDWPRENNGPYPRAKRIVSCCYHGIEDPWGACWEFDDGIQKYQNIAESDFTQSGYWFTTATSKYSLLDTSSGYGAAGSAFPAAGYTDNTTAWVSHAWPKFNGYINTYDALTYFATGRDGSSSTYLCDYYTNRDNSGTANGATILVRGGVAKSGTEAGIYDLSVIYNLLLSSPTVGARLAFNLK